MMASKEILPSKLPRRIIEPQRVDVKSPEMHRHMVPIKHND